MGCVLIVLCIWTASVDCFLHGSKCEDIPAYNELMSLPHHDTCVSVNSVFSKLYDIGIWDCQERLIHSLKNAFDHMPHNCECIGNNAYQTYPDVDSHTKCSHVNSYLDLKDEFFHHRHEHHPVCITHHTIWKELDHLNHESQSHGHSLPCVQSLINNLNAVFRDNDPCTCGDKHSLTTQHTEPTEHHTTPITPATTTASTTTIASTTPAPVSTTSHSAYGCDSSAMTLDIATAVHVNNSLASACDVTGSDEALVLKDCKLPVSETWRKGLNVQSDCQAGSPTIPKFAPVATFTGDTYNTTGGQSGIFLRCNGNGYLVAMQYCEGSPTVVNITSTPVVDAFYTIV